MDKQCWVPPFWKQVACYEHLNPDYPCSDYDQLDRKDISNRRRFAKTIALFDNLKRTFEHSEKRFLDEVDMDRWNGCLRKFSGSVGNEKYFNGGSEGDSRRELW